MKSEKSKYLDHKKLRKQVLRPCKVKNASTKTIKS